MKTKIKLKKGEKNRKEQNEKSRKWFFAFSWGKVVLGILLIAIGSSLLLLASILRGSNQANVTAEVKQNGQAALDSLDSQIRNAQDAKQLTGSDLPGTSPTAILLTSDKGKYFFIACFPSVFGTSNGWLGVASSSSKTTPSAASFTSLTNQDKIAGVDVSCGSGCDAGS